MALTFPDPPAGGRSTPAETVQRTITVLLAVDEVELRARLAAIITSASDLKLVTTIGRRPSMVGSIECAKADVLVLAGMGSGAGLVQAVRDGSLASPAMRILVLSEDPIAEPTLELLRNGMRGILTIEAAAATLPKAIRCVMAGQYWMCRAIVGDIVRTVARPRGTPSVGQPAVRAYSLTPAEERILDLIATGCSNKDIAAQRQITSATVKQHLTSIFHKTGANNRLQLALLAVKRDNCDVA